MRNNKSVDKSTQFDWSLNDGTLGLLGTGILLLSAVFWSARGPALEKTDFSMTYVGAKIIHQGEGSRLYDIELQKRIRDNLFAHPSPLFFEHPPAEAMLLSPLTRLPFRSVYTIWGVLNTSLWFLAIIFLRPYLTWPHELLGHITLWLLFAPLAISLYQGQSSIILMALFALTYALLKNDRQLLAGFALGFGLIKFQFVFPFVFIFVLRKQWRFLLGFLISSVIFAAFCVAAVGTGGIQHYVRFLLAIATNPQDVSYGSAVDMPTIHGFLFAVLGQRTSHEALSVISLFLSLLLLAWIARGWSNSKSRISSDLWFAAAIGASLLSGSHMFTQDFSPLIIGMFGSGRYIRNLGSRIGIPMASTMVLLWAFPVYFACIAWHCLYLMCPVLLLFVYCAIRGAKVGFANEIAQPEYVGA